MASSASEVPAEYSILCENCGYTLDKLPESGNCPECGQPIAASTFADGRLPSAWESDTGGGVGGFFRTSGLVIFRPSYFFRHTTTRESLQPAMRFAQIHWAIAAILFSLAAWFHQQIYAQLFPDWPFSSGAWLIPMVLVGFFGLWGITHLAARLTVWEARYRGIRLPRVAVLRGLYYHAAHFLPVCLLALFTTGADLWLLLHRRVWAQMLSTYLWILSGEVVVAAAYLFFTYWAAMRNMMYANR